jgi:glutamate formiminotransferase/glutamate formiminotransferase/formiminotetrahydrofolate cyclodeaminase
VAYNLWLSGTSLSLAKGLAKGLRQPALRALAFDLGGQVQISLNLTKPDELGPAHAYDLVAALAPIARAELVGLIPAAVLQAIPSHRWRELDLSEERTIEARLRG